MKYICVSVCVVSKPANRRRNPHVYMSNISKHFHNTYIYNTYTVQVAAPTTILCMYVYCLVRGCCYRISYAADKIFEKNEMLLLHVYIQNTLFQSCYCVHRFQLLP